MMNANRETPRTGEASQAGSTAAAAAPSVRWDDSAMRTSYANVVNGTGTREEVVLLFGIHQAWHGAVKEIPVQLQDRVILSPYAAKRLHLLMGHLLKEYEGRYGPLKVDASAVQVTPPEGLPSR